MNRNQVLQTIRDTLSQHPNSPLGELVPIVARQLRTRSGDEHHDDIAILPLNLVSAFIDGQATADQEQLVCESIERDNSVLAEIMAAIRCQDDTRTPSLSSDFHARLQRQVAQNLLQLRQANAEHASAHPEQFGEKVAPSSDEFVEAIIAPAPRSETHASPSAIASTAATRPSHASSFTNAEPPQSLYIGRWIAWSAAAVVSIAASLLLAWIGLGWMNSSPRPAPIAIEQPLDTQQPTAANDNQPDLQPDRRGAVDPSTDREPDQRRNNSESMEGQLRAPKLASDVPQTDNHKSPATLESDAPLVMDQPSKYQPPWSEVHWDRIQGLLVKQEVSSAADGASSQSSWMGAMSQTENQVDSQVRSVRWRTFPGSHAQAELQGGGRLVLQSDSEIELDRASARINQLTLKQGAVALVDMPEGTRLDVQLEGLPLTSLQWQSRATVVLASLNSGLQAQVQSGQVDINGQSHKNALVSIDPHSTRTSVASRLPLWINRPTEVTNLPRSLLQQLSRAADVEAELAKLLATPLRGLDENHLAQLGLWRGDLQDENFYLVLQNRAAAQRTLAFRRALSSPPWSRTWREFWIQLDAADNEPARLRQLNAIVLQAQAGTRLTREQANQLVNSLDSSNRATRALADLLLRQLVGNGPNYDPDLNAQQTPRVQGLWRRLINATIN